MTEPDLWSRRRLLGISLATAGLHRTAARAQEADRGLGGTGAAPLEPEEGGDRGIGGTGVVGTIRGFGSILVNGLRVSTPRSVPVRIDGRAARLRDLAIGHVVHVLAEHQGTHLATRRIDVFSEASGPIEALAPDGFTVLGQTVMVPDARLRRRWRAGHWVAVSGLRRLDGTIVASLVEPRAPGGVQVSGLPRLDPDGAMRVGNLAVDGLPGDALGQRLHVSGRLSAGRLMVEQARPLWLELLSDRPNRLSVEDYVALDGNGARFASGLPSNLDTSAAGFADETRAVVSATVTPAGRIQIDRVQPEGGGRGSGAGPSRSPRNTPPEGPRGAPAGRHQGFGADPGAGPDAGRPSGGQGTGGGPPAGRGGPGGGGAGSGRGSHP